MHGVDKICRLWVRLQGRTVGRELRGASGGKTFEAKGIDAMVHPIPPHLKRRPRCDLDLSGGHASPH